MPSPSGVKCRGPVVRQLSLQNPIPLQSPAGQGRGLRKQLSEDDARELELVEVTGQGWGLGSELRIGSGDGKIGQTKVSGTRPKPVKVAWADRKQDSTESPPRVEVVATKCQGQPRPMSVKAQRLRNPLLGNKDTLVYTRLQLAERLRNAWSEREKIKPNLNIFLAQGSETTRSENTEAFTDRTTGDGLHQDAASTLSDPSAPLDKKRKSMQVRAFSQEGYFVPGTNPKKEESNQNSGRSNEDEVEDTGRYLQELNKIEIRVTKIERPKKNQDRENQTPEDSPRDEESPSRVKRCRNKENLGSGTEGNKGKEVAGRPTAQDRRASFRRSSILHKTITDSFSSPKDEDKTEVKVPLKPTLKKPPLVRAFSAPSQSNDPSTQKKVKAAPLKKLQPTVSFDIPSAEDVAAMRDRIKSAPIRRKLKSAAARRKNKDKDSSDEEKEAKDATNKKTTRRSQTKNGDIVTMVSLVSPAASDTEDSVVNIPLESWRGFEGGKEETPSSRTSTSGGGEEAKDSSAFVFQKFVSLRKTAKSVTFQPHPVLSRSYSASFPSRRVPAGTPIVVPTPIISHPALTPAQLLERERRPSIFSDGRGIKRRLLRSSTEPAKEEQESLEQTQKPAGESKDPGRSSDDQPKNKDPVGDEEKPEGEPEFKSPKERECWNLYQKMVEKGVSVSFDTVLRGMLTPTEYRLRKNSLLSSCSPVSFL